MMIHMPSMELQKAMMCLPFNHIYEDTACVCWIIPHHA